MTHEQTRANGDGPNPRQLWDVRVPMRDGVELSADIHFPPGGLRGAPYPVLLERNCYTNQLAEEQQVRFTEHGFVVALQDVRGRNDSDGEYRPLHQEHDDGYDTVEWLAAQPWCDGNVGTIGGSYMGWTQWATASRRPPHLRAMWVSVPAGHFGRQEPFDHGILLLPVIAWLNLTGGRAFQSGRAVDWHRVYHHLPLVTMDEALGRRLPQFREWLAHPGVDDYWRDALVDDYKRIDVPTVAVTGWWDSNLKAGIALHEQLVAAGQADQHLIVGPWDHARIGEMTSLGSIEFGADAEVDLFAEQVGWFGHWLKGDEAAPARPRSRVFVTGANQWREDVSWPPPATMRTLYLHSNGDAGTRGGRLDDRPPGKERPDTYRYDPLDPVVAVPGSWDFYPLSVRNGIGDMTVDRLHEHGTADPENRPDVLDFTTEPAGTPAEFVGYPTMVLLAASDGPDTDWFVAVDDVTPEGAVLPLTTGQLRARFRESLEREVLLVPGEVTEFRLVLRPLAHRLQVGHRIRLTVTSSRFPINDRNPNTGAPIDAADGRTRVATNTVHHSAAAPSRLVLPQVEPLGEAG